MREIRITESVLAAYGEHLRGEEKSAATVEKYLREAAAFRAFAGGGEIGRDSLLAYKRHLIDSGYAARSVNAALAALNGLFSFLGRPDCRVTALKLQRQVFCPEERELSKAEYERLCRAAQRKHDQRLDLILQTICGTGIRVSELRFITVEAVRQGEAAVSLKGKTRTVFLVKPLRKSCSAISRSGRFRRGPCSSPARGGRCAARASGGR